MGVDVGHESCLLAGGSVRGRSVCGVYTCVRGWGLALKVGALAVCVCVCVCVKEKKLKVMLQHLQADSQAHFTVS